MHKIFVYGTLKSGYNNNYILEDQNFLGQACLVARDWCLQDCGFPYAVNGKYAPKDVVLSSILGEVYEVSDDVVGRLDWLEGEGRHYHRIFVLVHSGEEEILVQMYERRAFNPSLEMCRLTNWKGVACYEWL